MEANVEGLPRAFAGLDPEKGDVVPFEETVRYAPKQQEAGATSPDEATLVDVDELI